MFGDINGIADRMMQEKVSAVLLSKRISVTAEAATHYSEDARSEMVLHLATVVCGVGAGHLIVSRYWTLCSTGVAKGAALGCLYG